MRIKNGILSDVKDLDIPFDGNFVIPNSVTKIEDYAFLNCTSLTTVTIPEGVTSIGDYAFYRCINLKSVTIPDSVTTIGICVFSYCSSLEWVIISNNVICLGCHTFYDCKSLTSVNDLYCKCVDGYPMIIATQKQVSEYMIYKGYDIYEINYNKKSYYYAAEKDGFTAHGKTAKSAIEDLNFKITQDKLAKDPIYLDTVMTIDHYRAITGACSLGVNQWMKNQGIKESDKLTVQELLPILEKTKAYGFEKFKSLIKNAH